MEGPRDLEASPTAAQSPDKSATRFAFVDGLRGVAALCIVVFHAWWYEPEPKTMLESAHWCFDVLFLQTRRGVQILLVVSGFVIAYSLRNTWVTPREILLFVGRRAVRLAPAYWIAIGLALLVDVMCRGPLKLPSPFQGQPSIPRVLAHLAFLQDVFDFESLSAGLWTVCIEMQFYVVAVLGWGLAQRLFVRPENHQPQASSPAILVVFATLAVISLAYWGRLESNDHWVTHFLWRFFLGMLTWWTLDRTVPAIVFNTVVAIAVAQLVYELGFDPVFEWRLEWPSGNTVSLATALALFVAGRKERLHVWLNWRWLQFVGRISYSLYLVHFPVSHLVFSAGWRWFGQTPTSAQAAAIFLLSIVTSLVSAYALYVLAEAPSVRWAAKMKYWFAIPNR